jgi:nucleotide-binding universal stress UspA family protein
MIPQIRKILYATDLSKNSVYAFRYATEIAEKYDAEMIILHVIEPIPPMARHYMKIYVDETKWEEKIRYEQDLAIERIKKRLQEFCKQETQDAPQCLARVTTILVRPGYPVEEILKAADQEDCSMMVLGTHGKGFLKQTFLGSVARSVLDRAQKPVFIVPLPQDKTGLTVGDMTIGEI